ncbi:MAG: sensor histidine kinase [Deinococcus-Thermus bacterium]|nr:sensor histidine kinase [Deinococcota bacterium]
MAASTRGRLRLTLRAQLALVIALLSLLPNLVMAGLVFLPAIREAGGLAPRVGAGLAGWLIAVVAVSSLIGALLARVLLAPLTRVIRDADALPRTARRLALARLAVATDDPPEVTSLRGAINRLLAQVQTEQSRRSAFTATLMHDMKTPLLAQGNALRLLRDERDALSDVDVQGLLERAAEETEALRGLVQQLVDAHRFEQGEVRPRTTRIDVRELVDDEVERLHAAADHRGVRVEVDGAAAATVDPDLIARALANLVANAVRYASSQVRIEIRPGLLRIVDDGPGLPPPLDELARPFNDQPAEIAGRRYRAGSGGLGLYVARSILEAHGGRLVAEARGPGGTVLLAYLGRQEAAA